MPCCHAPISAPAAVPEVRIGCGKAVCYVSILQLCGRTTTDLHVPWGSLNLNSCEAFKEWRENERESHTHTQKRASLGEPIRNIKGFNKHGKLSKESLWLLAVLGKRKHTNKSSTDTSASMQALPFNSSRDSQFTKCSPRRSHFNLHCTAPWGRPVHGIEAVKTPNFSAWGPGDLKSLRFRFLISKRSV